MEDKFESLREKFAREREAWIIDKEILVASVEGGERQLFAVTEALQRNVISLAAHQAAQHSLRTQVNEMDAQVYNSSLRV